jgi:predicted MFS family arabinose efflux permease
MGLDSAVNSVARILGPIIFGTVYGSSGAAVAFMGAAATVLLAMVITMVRQYLTLRENESLLS